MITVYWADASELLQAEDLDKLLADMPAPIQAKIRSYKDINDRAVRIACKLMLNRFSAENGLDQEISLEQLQYTPKGKPYFPNTAFNFSSAHSGSLVVVAAFMRGKIGIDVEHLKPVAVEDLSDHFTVHEWTRIVEATDMHEALLCLWTRKEAVLKADGSGMLSPMNTLEVLSDEVVFNNNNYHIRRITVLPGYVVHLAVSQEESDINVLRFTLASSPI